MRLIFNHEGKPIEKPYVHSIAIQFPDFSKSGVLLLGKAYKKLEDWMDAVRKNLLPLGISDFQYEYLPPDKATGQLVVNFHLRDEVQLIQFCTITLGDKAGSFSRTIASQNFERAVQRQRNVEKFISDNDILASIIQIDAVSFKVVTNSRLNDWAIAIHHAKGQFDEGLQEVSHENAARIFEHP